MADLRPFLPPGRRVTAQLVQGPLYRGTVRRVVDGWLLLESESGNVLINLLQVAVITQEQGLEDDEASLEGLDDEEVLPKPTSVERPHRVSKVPARPWKDADLKQLSEAFLDGAEDGELAQRFHRTRGQLKELRQGFECARGNLVEDQISETAATWVERWQRLLGPQ